MSITDKIIPKYTYKDYQYWEGRWELIEGHPIAMSPLPVPFHQQIEGNLFIEFKQALKKSCAKCKVYLPLDYKISEYTLVQPDLLVVCNKIEKPYLDFPPVLVVEILSPSTMLRDKNTKYALYQQEGVLYYLIVDTNKKNIEIFKWIDGKYEPQNYINGYQFEFSEDCKIIPQLDNIWE